MATQKALLPAAERRRPLCPSSRRPGRLFAPALIQIGVGSQPGKNKLCQRTLWLWRGKDTCPPPRAALALPGSQEGGAST